MEAFGGKEYWDQIKLFSQPQFSVYYLYFTVSAESMGIKRFIQHIIFSLLVRKIFNFSFLFFYTYYFVYLEKQEALLCERFLPLTLFCQGRWTHQSLGDVCFTFYSNIYCTCENNYKNKTPQTVLVKQDTICMSVKLSYIVLFWFLAV